MNRFKNRLEYLIKHNRLVQFCYKHVFSLMLRLLGLWIPTHDKLILFSSFGGRKYNDSPKVLYLAMRNSSQFSDYRFVWAFEEPDKVCVQGAEKVKIDTLAYFKIALQAKIWITSVNIERGLSFKKKGTIYINTWHGAGTKKIGNACPHRKDYNLSNVDIMLTQSDFENEIFIRDFLCREDALLKCGFPRNDELFHISINDKQLNRKRFCIPEDKKVILYAPTWRDSSDGGITYDLNPPITISKWKEQLGNDYVFLFRTHTFTKNITNLIFDGFSKDVSDYDNLNHILMATDILITDYSTIVFDSSAANIPFICFGFDYEWYAKERGFYFELQEVYPSGVLYTEDEVLQEINILNSGVRKEAYDAFYKRFVESGGNATNIVLNSLKSLLDIKK